MANTSYQRKKPLSRLNSGEKDKKFYKTIIVGAGPAGLIAGRHLKDAIILDRRPRIQKMVRCIGLSVDTLERQCIIPSKPWAKATFYKIERVMPNGKVIGSFKKDPIGYVVEKYSFERFLAKGIKAELVLGQSVSDIFFDGNYWQVKTKKGDVFRSKYIIAADGFDSIVRKNLFPEAEKCVELAFGLEYVLEFSKKIDSRIVKMYFDNRFFKKGYGWVFPVSTLSAIVGVGGSSKYLERTMEHFLDKNITSDYGEFSVLGKSLGVTSSKKCNFPFFKSNAFLVGDAAGFNDPLFKAGTSQAMVSARIAAECIIKNRPSDYNKIINTFPFTQLKNKKIGDVFYSLNNRTLNALGNLLEGRGFSHLNRPIYLVKFFKNKTIRKDIAKVFYFFIVWNKTKEWLW